MSENCEIEFVYFDLGNVLVSFDPRTACQNMAQRFGVSLEQADAAIYHSGVQDQFEHGEIDGQQFADSIRQQLGRDESAIPTAALLDAVSAMFEPIASMAPVLRQVRESGCRVGLLSNTCHAHWDWIQRQRYEATTFAFDTTILSYEIGSMKPDAKIYQAAEQAAGVSGDRILFLDDKQENVQAARQHRWHAVQCMGGQPAIEALQSFSVLGETS